LLTMKRTRKITHIHTLVPKLRTRASKQIRNEEEYNKVEGITSYNNTSEHIEGVAFHFENNIVSSYGNTSEHIEGNIISNFQEEDLLGLTIEEAVNSLNYNHVPLEIRKNEVKILEDYDLLEGESFGFKGFNGKYGLYFPNFTSAMLFVWITKHMISTSAYEDLAKILTHPEYQKEDVTMNVCQIRKWRDRLPLAKIRKYDVPICMQQVPSTCESSKK
ncbi:12539_t:CDS:2, partial [Funneliformis caledonium]